ncbi:MAG: hypothetical protein JOZ17_10720 [Acetobacteraceae bacterium]|nr:hypothetical protein [Acetobacteraceae bacterium]
MTPSVETASELQSPWNQSIRIAFGFLFAVVGILAALWPVSNVRQISADTRGVVLRFGDVVRVQGSGLLLAWPAPLEEVVLLPSSAHAVELRLPRLDGPASDSQSFDRFRVSTDPRENVSFLLAGDQSVVHLGAVLFYRVTDPAAFLLAREQVPTLLERLLIASAVTVCAGRDLDSILVAGPKASAAPSREPGLDGLKEGTALSSGPPSSVSREQLRADLLREVNRRLEDLARNGAGVGIEVARIDLAIELPSTAKAAFDQVLVSTQQADGAIAQARTDAEARRQKAEQERSALIYRAQAAGKEVVAQARTRTAPIQALAQDPVTSSVAVELDRIYYDRMGKILRAAHRVDTFDEVGSRLILPGAGK